jgi:alpha-tubulin suppressor-like RCC1 family protein
MRLGAGRVARWATIAVLGLMAFAAEAAVAETGVVAWGNDEYDQLGVSDTVPNFSLFGNVFEPVPLGYLSGSSALSSGNSFTLALRADGSVSTWGYNGSGQLGIGTHNGPGLCGFGEDACSQTPVAVSGLSGVVAVAAGGAHGLALLNNGTVMAWGNNSRGELGLGTVGGTHDSPVAVPGLSGVKAIAAGDTQSFAVLQDGTVMAWGWNNSGALGVGSTELEACGSEKKCLTKPTAVGGLAGVKAVAVGEYHGLALLEDGTVKAWGNNGAGQLGDGTTTSRNSPVAVNGLTEVAAVAAGQANSMALLADGTVMDWGTNNGGRLGIGTETGPETCGQFPCSTAPVAVGGSAPATAIAAGSEFSLELLSDGTVRAWGSGIYGTLGGGEGSGPCPASPRCSSSPVAVSGLSGATAIAAGDLAGFATIGLGGERPVVSNVSPHSGSAETGATVTITGANFTGATSVFIGSIRASSFTVNNASSITATFPALSQQMLDVSVVSSQGYSAGSEADRYTFRALPTVTALAPSYGPTYGGTQVAIGGTQLGGTTSVRFGNVNATSFKVTSKTSLVAVAPPGAIGKVEIRVTNASGVNSKSPHFNYVPTVEVVAPHSGPKAGNTSVTVTGTGFAPGTGGTSFYFGTSAALGVSCASSTTCTMTTPPHAGGRLPVRAVVNKENSPSSKTALFTFN